MIPSASLWPLWPLAQNYFKAGNIILIIHMFWAFKKHCVSIINITRQNYLYQIHCLDETFERLYCKIYVPIWYFKVDLLSALPSPSVNILFYPKNTIWGSKFYHPKEVPLYLIEFVFQLIHWIVSMRSPNSITEIPAHFLDRSVYTCVWWWEIRLLAYPVYVGVNIYFIFLHKKLWKK